MNVLLALVVRSLALGDGQGERALSLAAQYPGTQTRNPRSFCHFAAESQPNPISSSVRLMPSRNLLAAARADSAKSGPDDA